MCRPARRRLDDERPARDRQQLLDDDVLDHHRLELVVGEIDAVDLAAGERIDRRTRDLLRMVVELSCANRFTCS